MGKPRFRPAQVMENPRHFGRSDAAVMVRCPDLTEAEHAWAWYQHRVALEVLRDLERREISVEQFANQLEEDTAWLTRKLHGQAPADLGEMFEWALRLGVHVLPAIDEVDDIRPMSV